MKYDDDIMYIIGIFKSKQYHKNKLKKLKNELYDLEDSDTYGVSAMPIKYVVIENHKPFTNDLRNELIEKKQRLEYEIRETQHSLYVIDKYYSMLKDPLVKQCVEMLYFKHMHSQIVASSINYSIGGMYKRINNDIRNSILKHI